MKSFKANIKMVHSKNVSNQDMKKIVLMKEDGQIIYTTDALFL